MTPTYLTPQDLCDRYKNKIAPRTLANWRSEGSGPAFTKIGGRVLYALDAIRRWERKRTKEIKSLITIFGAVALDAA
jgi:hypothetical protein